MDERSEISIRYTRFAEEEARGRSPLYESIARGVAADEGSSASCWTCRRPSNNRSAARGRASCVRHAEGLARLSRLLLSDRDAVYALMQVRSTQTNEPARCATLLPVLAQLPQPLALVEVGASAGLCLLPDHYGYDYGHAILGTRSRPSAAPSTTPCRFRPCCRVSSGAPGSTSIRSISTIPEVAWLETLVWPEQTERLGNLRAALRIAAAAKPRVVKGDLAGDTLAQLALEAPRHATRVIFHSAVLAYVADQAERQAFAERAMRLGTWISNEMPDVFPDIARRVGVRGAPGRFLLSVNGTPVAWTDSHGRSIDWI